MRRLTKVALALAALTAGVIGLVGAASGDAGGVKIAHDAAVGKLKPAKLTTTGASGGR